MAANHPVQYAKLPADALPDGPTTGAHCYTKKCGAASVVIRVRTPSCKLGSTYSHAKLLFTLFQFPVSTSAPQDVLACVELALDSSFTAGRARVYQAFCKL